MSTFERRNYIQVIFISQVNGVASFVTHLHNVPVIFLLSLWLGETLTQARCNLFKKKGGGGGVGREPLAGGISPPPLSLNNSLLPILVKDKRKAVFLFLFFSSCAVFLLCILVACFQYKVFLLPRMPWIFCIWLSQTLHLSIVPPNIFVFEVTLNSTYLYI